MKKRGIGIGAMCYGIGYGFARPDFSTAVIEIGDEGAVTLRLGEVDYGQGSDTVFSQIIAEELGVPPDSVRLIRGDTATTPLAGPSSASRVTYTVGNAVLKAARAMREAIEPVAAEILGEPDLIFSDGEIRSTSRPEKRIGFEQLIRECHYREMRLVQTARHEVLTGAADPDTGQGDIYATYAYATQLAEVEVDTDTGKVEVLRLIAAHDVGKAIHPQNIEGQIEGGVAMGLGYALTEEVQQECGVPGTRTLADYLVPTSLDVPRVEVHIVEVPAPGGPYGAKGVAEPALVPTAPAILNAIRNALGIRITELPASLETIQRLIRERGAG